MVDSLVRKIQSSELEMLVELIDAFKKMNISYYVIGGTALGAVRHKGFIPWDDDIDIALKRDDYDLFISKGQSFLPKHMFIQTFHNEKEYFLPFAKVRNSNTTFIEIAQKNNNINHGIYIDIFPLDNASNYRYKNRFLFKRLSVCYLILSLGFYINKRKISFLKRMLREMLLLLHVNPKFGTKLYDKNIRKFNKSPTKFYANFCGAWGYKEIVPSHCFEGGCVTKFEGIDVVIPNHIDEYLTLLYGNYMKLPPENKRCPHHETIVIDVKNNYKKYICDSEKYNIPPF